VVQRLNHESVILLAETDKGTCDGSIVLRPTTNLFPYQEICGANVKIRELLANAGNITAELSSGGQEECEVFITAATDPDIEGVDDLVALVLAMPASSFCTEATRAAYIALLKKHIPLPTYRFRFGDPAPLPLTDVQSIATLSTEYLMKELLRARPGWLGPLSGDGGPGTTHPADTQEACSRALVPVKKISPISIAVGATVAVASLAGGIGAGYLLWGRKKTPALAS
jgi:hypothetical protein